MMLLPGKRKITKPKKYQKVQDTSKNATASCPHVFHIWQSYMTYIPVENSWRFWGDKFVYYMYTCPKYFFLKRWHIPCIFNVIFDGNKTCDMSSFYDLCWAEHPRPMTYCSQGFLCNLSFKNKIHITSKEFWFNWNSILIFIIYVQTTESSNQQKMITLLMTEKWSYKKYKRWKILVKPKCGLGDSYFPLWALIQVQSLMEILFYYCRKGKVQLVSPKSGIFTWAAIF